MYEFLCFAYDLVISNCFERLFYFESQLYFQSSKTQKRLINESDINKNDTETEIVLPESNR